MIEAVGFWFNNHWLNNIHISAGYQHNILCSMTTANSKATQNWETFLKSICTYSAQLQAGFPSDNKLSRINWDINHRGTWLWVTVEHCCMLNVSLSLRPNSGGEMISRGLSILLPSRKIPAQVFTVRNTERLSMAGHESHKPMHELPLNSTTTGRLP